MVKNFFLNTFPTNNGTRSQLKEAIQKSTDQKNSWLEVSFYTTVDVESQCLKGSRNDTFWANASLVFCLFRYAIKNLWREGCSNAPALLRRRSSGFGNLLSTLVRFAANGALWRVYYFVHWIIRPLVKIVESGLVSEGAPCLCRVTEWIKDIFQIGTLSNADM